MQDLPMSRDFAIRVLDDHCIRWKENGAWIDVASESYDKTLDIYHLDWIECPDKYRALLNWLGY